VDRTSQSAQHGRTGRGYERPKDRSGQRGTARNHAEALYSSATDTTSQEGQRLLDTVGPEHDVVVDDWSTIRGRIHTVNSYDQGAPGGGPFNLITTTTTSARYTVNGVDTDTDLRTSTTGCDWTLRTPISNTIDPTGLNLTTRTGYDATTGLVTTTTTPAGGVFRTGLPRGWGRDVRPRPVPARRAVRPS
jgi:hypothetical protein